MSEQDPRADYEASLRMAGIVVPEERDTAMFEAFKVVREMMAELNRPWRYDEEPAFIHPPAMPKAGAR